MNASINAARYVDRGIWIVCVLFLEEEKLLIRRWSLLLLVKKTLTISA